MKKSNIIYIIFVVLMQFVAMGQSKKWTIEECVNYAIEHNITIQQAQLDNELVDIDKLGAYGNFLPSINANASHSWNNGLNPNYVPGLNLTSKTETVSFTSTGINASVDIYNGLQNLNRLRRSNLAQIASQYRITKIKDDVSLNVANAFLQILFNKENIKVQKELLSTNEKQLERTQQLVDAGSIPRGDLLDIKATVADSKQKVISAENALLISKLSLAQLLQLEDFQNFDIADEDFGDKQSEVMFQTADAIYKKALEERVEVKLANANMELAKKDVQIARGAYHPNLSGFYSYNTQVNYADRPIFDIDGNLIGYGGHIPFFDQFRDNRGHNWGLQLNIPILNGFLARNNVSRSKVELKRSEVALSQAQLDLERSVYTAFTDANGAFNTYESSVAALEARESAFNYAKERYAVGMMNAFDFNQAQTLYSNAQSEVIRTKYDYIFRTKIVELYFGIPIAKRP